MTEFESESKLSTKTKTNVDNPENMQDTDVAKRIKQNLGAEYKPDDRLIYNNNGELIKSKLLDKSEYDTSDDPELYNAIRSVVSDEEFWRFRKQDRADLQVIKEAEYAISISSDSEDIKLQNEILEEQTNILNTHRMEMIMSLKERGLF